MTVVKNSNKLELIVKKVKRSWCICAGCAVLGKFRTEEQAIASLDERRGFYEYWAESAGVISQNAEPVTVIIQV